MSLAFLAEHVDRARIALDLAQRESAHLRYTYDTLYAEAIDRTWVEDLAVRQDLAEKIDAFVARFGRLQDHIGDKLLPAFSKMLGGQPKALVDVVVFAERQGWVSSAEEFIGARKLRNLLVHEYMSEPDLFLEALLAAKPATELLFQTVLNIEHEASTRGLIAVAAANQDFTQ